MSEQAEWEKQLTAALRLMRDFRYRAIVQGIDARATRIALKCALLMDDYVCKEKGLTQEEDAKLTAIAQDLFNQLLQEEQARAKAHQVVRFGSVDG